jgi:hypothetical protein
MFRRALLPLTMALAALSLAGAPAFAGEDPDPAPPSPPAAQPAPTPTQTPSQNASADLRTRGCLSHDRARFTVSGDLIDSVAFYVDGKRVATDTSANSSGDYTYSMSCSRLSYGTHSARAAVAFQQGVTPTNRTLRFRITRTQVVRPQFAG